MTACFVIERHDEESNTPSRRHISDEQYRQLSIASSVVGALWYFEESYDILLQNAIEFQTAVARLEANSRVNISSFPDDADLEIRQLNRLLTNFLSSCKSFVDTTKARFSSAGEALPGGQAKLECLFSEQFDASFSYRLMDALRNVTQHRGSAIEQTLTMIKTVYSRNDTEVRVLSVAPQIMRQPLLDDKRVRSETRKQIAEQADEVIDLTPHISEYVRCFGAVVLKARELFDCELRAALETFQIIFGDDIKREWAFLSVTDTSPTDRQQTLFVHEYELRRLERIRLRNYARDLS